MHFHLRGCHALWPAFPDRSINTFLSLVLTKLTRSLSPDRPVDYCGPATPDSPFESPGLGSSEFARHYFRNHGCFLFLRVLRWFTSPGSLDHPMYSDDGNRCSHRLGFPIRKSPDHSLLAASRGLSQLTTSFFAYLRQGIHTHALSSLTIKSTSHTQHRTVPYIRLPPLFDTCPCLPSSLPLARELRLPAVAYCLALTYLCFVMPVNIQLSKISIASAIG